MLSRTIQVEADTLIKVRSALRRINEQATRRARGTTVKRYLITDLEIIENIYSDLSKRELKELDAAITAHEAERDDT